jgi:hypothetical protein
MIPDARRGINPMTATTKCEAMVREAAESCVEAIVAARRFLVCRIAEKIENKSLLQVG